jgi:hypothetical protein
VQKYKVFFNWDDICDKNSGKWIILCIFAKKYRRDETYNIVCGVGFYGMDGCRAVVFGQFLRGNEQG